MFKKMKSKDLVVLLLSFNIISEPKYSCFDLKNKDLIFLVFNEDEYRLNKCKKN